MLKGSDFEVAPIQMHKNTTVKFGHGSGYVTEYPSQPPRHGTVWLQLT